MRQQDNGRHFKDGRKRHKLAEALRPCRLSDKRLALGTSRLLYCLEGTHDVHDVFSMGALGIGRVQMSLRSLAYVWNVTRQHASVTAHVSASGTTDGARVAESRESGGSDAVGGHAIFAAPADSVAPPARPPAPTARWLRFPQLAVCFVWHPRRGRVAHVRPFACSSQCGRGPLRGGKAGFTPPPVALSTKTALNSIDEWYPALSAYLRGSKTYTVAALLVRADVGAIIREVPLIRVTFEVDARYIR